MRSERTERYPDSLPAFDYLKRIHDGVIEQALVVVAKSRISQITRITPLKYDVHTDNMIALRQMTRLGCGKKKTNV